MKLWPDHFHPAPQEGRALDKKIHGISVKSPLTINPINICLISFSGVFVWAGVGGGKEQFGSTISKCQVYNTVLRN